MHFPTTLEQRLTSKMIAYPLLTPRQFTCQEPGVIMRRNTTAMLPYKGSNDEQKEGPVMMKQQHQDYEAVPFPKLRRALAITYPSVQRKPMIHGLLEVDVTRAREYLRDHKAKTGESLSFTAFIITCMAHAVDENKALHACRKGRKQLVLFDEVDVATPIEREMEGQKQPMIYIIRAANKKDFRAIHEEIRASQVATVEHAWEGYKDFRFLPLVAFRAFWPLFCWMRRRFPLVQKKYGGTVGVTAVGMFGTGGGWGILSSQGFLSSQD
jgi:hypothetical protein